MSDLKIHCFSSGTVMLRPSQITGKSGPLRRAALVTDRAWTDHLPIHFWAIEHPQGTIVVDTGETARATKGGYFPWWNPYFRLALKLQLTEQLEAGPQLRAAGIDPAAVSKVVMTHMHTDHAGGLHHFPGAEIVIAASEWNAVGSRRAEADGYVVKRLPEWLSPTTIGFGETGDQFESSVPLTATGDVRLVSTPGHTAGHASVLVEQPSGKAILLAGDTSYTQQNMLDLKPDGVSPSAAAVRRTLKQIRDFAGRRELVYLPSHDPDSKRRLQALEPAIAL